MKPCSNCGVPIQNQLRMCTSCASKKPQKALDYEIQDLSISTTPLKTKAIDCGAFPTYGVSRVGSRIFFRLSRSVYLMALLSISIGISLLVLDYSNPLNACGLFFAFGGIAIPLIGLFITKNRFWGTKFEIDIAKQTVNLSRGNETSCFGLADVVGLQILDNLDGCQLNLVTLSKYGETDRTFVYAHHYGYYVRRIANQLTFLSSIQILKYTFEHSGDGG